MRITKRAKPPAKPKLSSPPAPKTLILDGETFVPEPIMPKGTRSNNPDLLGERRGNRIVLSDSIRSVADSSWCPPWIVGHYIQTITNGDNNAHVDKRQLYSSKERASGIHASGVINVLTRRIPGVYLVDEELPNKMTQGLAIEKHYMGFPWHTNTFYQPGPLVLDDIHLSPDGITPTMDPYTLRTFPNMNWIGYQPYMLEEMKSTYYSSKRVRDGGLVRDSALRGWLYQQAMYLQAFGAQRNPYGLFMKTEPGKPYLSRLTVWWVMDDHSWQSNPPVCECWILGWDYHAVNSFWNKLVLPNRSLAKPEVH